MESQMNEMLDKLLMYRKRKLACISPSSMSQPGVTGVLCADNQGLALAGILYLLYENSYSCVFVRTPVSYEVNFLELGYAIPVNKDTHLWRNNLSILSLKT